MFKAILSKLIAEAPIAPGSLLEQCVLLMLQLYSEAGLPTLLEHLQRLNAQTTSPEPKAHLWRLEFLRLWQQRQANFCAGICPPFNLSRVNAQIIPLVITRETPISLLTMKHDDGLTVLGRAVNLELLDFTRGLFRHIQHLHADEPNLIAQMILGKALNDYTYLCMAATLNNGTLFKPLFDICYPALLYNKQLLAVLMLLVEQYRPITEQFYTSLCHRLAKRVTIERLTEIAQLLLANPEKILEDTDRGSLVLMDVLYQLHANRDGGEDILRTCLPRAQGTSHILAQKLLILIDLYNDLGQNPQHPLLQCKEQVQSRIHEMPQKNDCCLTLLTRLTRLYLSHYQSIRYLLMAIQCNDEGIQRYTCDFFAREQNAGLTPLAPYMPTTLPAFIRVMVMLNKSLFEKQLRQAKPELRAQLLKITHGQLIQMKQQHHLGDDKSMFGTFFYGQQEIDLNFPFMFLTHLFQLKYVKNIVTSMLQTLIVNGLPPNLVSAHGITPLNLALLANNHELAQLLITHGADVNINYRDHNHSIAYRDGTNLLYILDYYRIADSETKEAYLRIVKFLLAAGAYVYLPCRGTIIQETVLNGITPFEYAFKHQLSDLCESMVATQQPAHELFEKVTRIAVDLIVLRAMIKYNIKLTHNAKKNAPLVLEHIKNELKELKKEHKRPFVEVLKEEYFNAELRFYFVLSAQPALIAEYDSLCHEHLNRSKISPQTEDNTKVKEIDKMFEL